MLLDMDREEALKNLREGSPGISKWNAWRKDNPDAELPDFSGVDLAHKKLAGANLQLVTLAGADLRDSNLASAILAGSDLRRVELTPRTSLSNAVVNGCKIDRIALHTMDGFGGLTAGQLATMNVEDGLAKLRNQYSGFWQWVHLIALAAFVAPYLWFVLIRFPSSVEAGIGPSVADQPTGTSLLSGLAKYI